MTIFRTTTIALTLIAAAFSLVTESLAQRPANLFAETYTVPSNIEPHTVDTDPIQDIYRAALAMRHVNKMLNSSTYGSKLVVDGQPRLLSHNDAKKALEELGETASVREYFGTNFEPRNLNAVACKSCGDLNLVVFSDDHTVFVSIYGTRGGNGIYNAGISLNRHEFDMAGVHSGWSALATANYDWIKKVLDANGARAKRVIFTGHSLGGPVAGYLSFLLVKDGYLDKSKEHRLVTFGAPRYGTADFLYVLNARAKGNAPKLKVYSVEFSEDDIPHTWNAANPLVNISPAGSLLKADGSYCGVTSNHHDTPAYFKLAKKYTGND